MSSSASTITETKTYDNADTPESSSDDHVMLGEESEDSDVEDVEEEEEEEEDGDDESEDTELSKIEIRLHVVHFCSTLLLEQRYLTSYTTPSSLLHYTTSSH